MRASRPAIDRLRDRLDMSDPDACWPLSGAATRSGHAQIWSDGAMRLAHRVMWEAVHGAIPDGLVVMHACDNPPCCNPAHLGLGTVADNNADRDRKGRGVLPPPHLVKRREAGPTVHGTVTAYVKRRCRCGLCREANSTYRRAARARAAQSERTPTP